MSWLKKKELLDRGRRGGQEEQNYSGINGMRKNDRISGLPQTVSFFDFSTKQTFT